MDDDGVERVVGDVWQHSKNKCMIVVCTTDGARDQHQPCPPIPDIPDTDCLLGLDGCGTNCVLQPDECGCVTWNCATEPFPM